MYAKVKICFVKAGNSRIVADFNESAWFFKAAIAFALLVATQKDITRFDWLFTPNPGSPEGFVPQPVSGLHSAFAKLHLAQG